MLSQFGSGYIPYSYIFFLRGGGEDAYEGTNRVTSLDLLVSTATDVENQDEQYTY